MAWKDDGHCANDRTFARRLLSRSGLLGDGLSGPASEISPDFQDGAPTAPPAIGFGLVLYAALRCAMIERSKLSERPVPQGSSQIVNKSRFSCLAGRESQSGSQINVASSIALPADGRRMSRGTRWRRGRRIGARSAVGRR